MKRWLILLCLVLLPVCALAQDASLDVTWDGKSVTGYASCPLTITTDTAGEVTLAISDGKNNWLNWTLSVPVGETTVPWMGLGDNDERIPNGNYTFTATLKGDDGDVTQEQSITFTRCKNALLFALPSDDTLYLDDEDGWFTEVCLIREGTVCMEISPADDPEQVIYTRQNKVSSSEPKKLTWDGHAGKTTLAAGEYLLRYYESKNPDWAHEVRITIAEGTRPTLALQPTGDYLPAYTDPDDVIWAMMQQPSAVINIRSVAHQNVYASPDQKSQVLGTLHGQSQTVDVQEIGLDGWTLIGAWNHEQGEYVQGYVPTDCLTMVEPNSEYGLLLDKKQQRMAVFHQGERIAEIDVSTGLVAQDKLIRETAAGSFLTLEHMDAFSMNGQKYDYVIRYDGGNLLHQIPYKWANKLRDFSESTLQLGSKASQGCIRLPRDKGTSGINAYWLWTHLHYHTRVIILDDPLQRQAQAAAAEAGRDVSSAAEVTAVKAPQPLQEGETELIMTLGGDAVLGTREAWWKKTEAFPAYVERNGAAYFFAGLEQVFATDDMTFINLECVLKDNSRGEDKDKQYRFRGLPSYTEILKAGSVEQVNIANNHYIDYGSAGKTATRAALEEAGVPYSGFESTYVWEQDGWRIGFAGCRETVYKRDKQVIARDVAALREAGCDVIIYSCHWGKEYSAGHNALQEEMAQVCADLGVDIVVGNHPHVVQGVSTVDDTVVFWSLGNLLFGGTHDMTTFDATLARVNLRFDQQGYVGCTVRMIPILTSSSADIGLNDFRPCIAKDDDAARILAKIQADSGVTLLEEMYFPARQDQ